MSSFGSVPPAHAAQVPFDPAKPSAHRTHTAALLSGSVPGAHAAHTPLVPAYPTAHGWHCVRSAVGSCPALHRSHCPPVPAKPTSHATHEVLCAFGSKPSAHTVQVPSEPADTVSHSAHDARFAVGSLPATHGSHEPPDVGPRWCAGLTLAQSTQPVRLVFGSCAFGHATHCRPSALTCASPISTHESQPSAPPSVGGARPPFGSCGCDPGGQLSHVEPSTLCSP